MPEEISTLASLRSQPLVSTTPSLIGSKPTPRPDARLVREFWRALVHPGDVHEVRIPKSRRGPRGLRGRVSGYFDQEAAFIAAIQHVTGDDGAGVYVTLNPVDPALLARADNRLQNWAEVMTRDANIPRLRHLLLDLDPVYEKGISATDAERDEALALRDAVLAYLREEEGWPEPVAVTESGNGGALVYAIDLPNDEECKQLLKDVLTSLGAMFNSAHATVDTSTFNPSRLIKIVGTIAAKGDHVSERPWRLATGTFNSSTSQVSRDQLARLVAAAVESIPDHEPDDQPAGGGHEVTRRWSVRDLLDRKGIGYTERVRQYGTVLQLDRCLTSAEHDDGACVVEFPSGAAAYRCLHNRCADKHWEHVRELLGLRPRMDGHVSNLGSTESKANGRRAHLVVTSLADVEPRPVDWLWKQWLARGKVNLIGGHPGDGKSTLTAWIAARLSQGGSGLIWPDADLVPLGRSLFLLGEDSLEDTLRPRLDLHGADPAMVFAVEAVREPNGSASLFNLQRHLPELEQTIQERSIDLLVIDPLSSFMANSDRNGEGNVRDILTPLGKLAEGTGVAVLGVMHVGKPSGAPRRPLQQLLGSTGFGAIARLVSMVAPVPGADPTRRVFGVVKSNLATHPPALEWSRAEDAPIVWHGPSPYAVDDLLGGGSAQARPDGTDFLLEVLKDGPLPAKDVIAQAAAAGISEHTLRRRAKDLGITSEKAPGVKDGPWLWALPEEKMANP